MYVIKLNNGTYHRGGFMSWSTPNIEMAKFYCNVSAAKGVITQNIKRLRRLGQFHEQSREWENLYRNAEIKSVCVVEDPHIEIIIDCEEKLVCVEGIPDSVMIDIPGFKLWCEDGDFD